MLRIRPTVCQPAIKRPDAFVNPAHRHQLDALTDEWGVPLVEVVRRVLSRGLRHVMHGDTG